MGYYSGESRESVIARYMRPQTSSDGTKAETLKHARKGTNDWFLVQITKADGTVERTILLNHWEHGSYKPMDESVGPYYYNVPKSWLKELTEPASEYARDWREKVLNGNAEVSANG